MIKAVIFDCFGVLTTDLWREFMDSLPDNSHTEHLRQLNRQLDAGFMDQDEFMDEVGRLTGRTPTRIEELINNDVKKNLRLLDYISEIKKSGLKIGIISNISSDWIRSQFLSATEQALFDDIVMSFEVHMTKPDPLIFELACKRLSVKSGQTIFVDDVEGNCTAAANYGIKSILYQDFRTCKRELDKLLSDSNN